MPQRATIVTRGLKICNMCVRSLAFSGFCLPTMRHSECTKTFQTLQLPEDATNTILGFIRSAGDAACLCVLHLNEAQWDKGPCLQLLLEFGESEFGLSCV
eukprot:3254028-Amphidinium_carterae.1